MDPHSFFADPDPPVLFNADPDPAAFLMLIRIQLHKICKNYLMKVEKVTKDCLKVKKHRAGPNLLQVAVSRDFLRFFHESNPS